MRLNLFNNFSSGIIHRIKNLFLVSGCVILLSLIFEFLGSSNSTAIDNPPFNQNYKIFPVPIPDTMSFAGEQVPMNHFGIRENLEQEILINTYWQSQTLLMLKRANRYFPAIEQILKKNGIPEDFKFLALAESGFSYKSSPAGAVGFWQILKSTAEYYGLEVNRDVDERYNLDRSTEAACKYFKESYAEFHNWTLVAASYNMGLAGVAKELQKQKGNNYYDLELNSETARYVYRILALKELVGSPDKFGFFLKKSDLYTAIPYSITPVDSTINDLAEFAIDKGINYRILKILNPWLLTDKLPNPEKKMYAISIPQKNVPFLDLGEYITFTDSSLLAAGAMKKDTVPAKIVIHKVMPGEDLESIAKQYNVTKEQLLRWNSISDSVKVKPKDEIMIFEK
ncbi:MAG TPA: transglycosylase SLT domain-containing protein [Bacteroidia bacterium]|nr:transglycosylase SLT domain-containing protein [Bacteroidia bacterium]